MAVDREFALWQLYEPHGWPALFLWGQGGALRWYHLGEGDYAATEQAIREALPEAEGDPSGLRCSSPSGRPTCRT